MERLIKHSFLIIISIAFVFQLILLHATRPREKKFEVQQVKQTNVWYGYKCKVVGGEDLMQTPNFNEANQFCQQMRQQEAIKGQ